MKRLILATLLMAGCATQQTNPQATIFQVKSSYDLALNAIITYDRLPPCVANGPKLCSDARVTQKLQQAAQVANTAINSAETAVRDPSFDKSKADATVIAAQNAVIALTSILATLQGTP